jgi:DNA-directed RNA polymerase subunit RPC12/RpoP
MKPSRPARICKVCGKVVPLKKGDYCDSCRVTLENGGRPPLYICKECGTTYGEEKHQGGGETQWHKARCHICGKKRLVTHYRKFGYLMKGELSKNLDREKYFKKLSKNVKVK